MATIFERASAALSGKAVQAANKALPKGMREYGPLARKLLFKGPEGLLQAGMDMVLEKYGGLFGLPSNIPHHSEEYFGPFKLLGGLTRTEAQQIFDESMQIDYAVKNLFLVRVTNLSAQQNDFDVNFFVTDVSYPGMTAAGEDVRIGSGMMDQVTHQEKREIRLTTMDDRYGSIKRWFGDLSDKMTRPDGAVGLPLDYLVRIDILHAYPFAFLANDEGYVDTFIVRPGNSEYDHSRRDQAMAEIQLSFTQWDTFTTLY